VEGMGIDRGAGAFHPRYERDPTVIGSKGYQRMRADPPHKECGSTAVRARSIRGMSAIQPL